MKLRDAVARIARLDEERTQGRWHCQKAAGDGPGSFHLLANDKAIADYRSENAQADLAFAVESPLMAQVVAEQRRRLQYAITMFQGMAKFSPHEEVRSAAAHALKELQEQELHPRQETKQ